MANFPDEKWMSKEVREIARPFLTDECPRCSEYDFKRIGRKIVCQNCGETFRDYAQLHGVNLFKYQRETMMSLGWCAGYARMDKWAFMKLVGIYEIPIAKYDADDFEAGGEFAGATGEQCEWSELDWLLDDLGIDKDEFKERLDRVPANKRSLLRDFAFRIGFAMCEPGTKAEQFFREAERRKARTRARLEKLFQK